MVVVVVVAATGATVAGVDTEAAATEVRILHIKAMITRQKANTSNRRRQRYATQQPSLVNCQTGREPFWEKYIQA
jgi:hypothetical protein